MVSIIPAPLEKDIRELENKLNIIKNFAQVAQIDIADGKFVDNKTIGLEDLKNINIDMDFELHLMVENPRKQFAACQELRAKRVFWHYEADSDIDGATKFARQFSFKKGIVLNNETNISTIKKTCQCFDAVMLMGVVPGAQGRGFIFNTIERVKELKKIFNGPVAVDGGINENNITKLAQAGADQFMVGSALFKSSDIEKKYKELQKLIS